jgi:hypothetical protein
MNEEELKHYLFELCSANKSKYVYVEAYVKIEKRETGYSITGVNWSYTKLDYHLSEEDVESSLVDIESIEVEGEGYYVLKGLFSVEYDSDDYRSWCYLGEEHIIEYVFCSTIEEGNRNSEVINNIEGNYLFDF